MRPNWFPTNSLSFTHYSTSYEEEELIRQKEDARVCWLGANQGNFRIVNFLTWCRNPCETLFLLVSNLPDFTMSEEPNIRRTTAPRRSTRYEVTHLETGSLASRSSAAFIRRRRHIQQEIQDTLQKLKLHSKVMELRHALRALEAKNTEDNPGHNDDAGSSRSHPNKAIPAWIEQQPKKPEPKEEIAPATGQFLESTAHARTVGAASAQRTEVSQRTLSHLPITSIDSHIPPPTLSSAQFFRLSPLYSQI